MSGQVWSAPNRAASRSRRSAGVTNRPRRTRRISSAASNGVGTSIVPLPTPTRLAPRILQGSPLRVVQPLQETAPRSGPRPTRRLVHDRSPSAACRRRCPRHHRRRGLRRQPHAVSVLRGGRDARHRHPAPIETPTVISAPRLSVNHCGRLHLRGRLPASSPTTRSASHPRVATAAPRLLCDSCRLQRSHSSPTQTRSSLPLRD